MCVHQVQCVLLAPCSVLRAPRLVAAVDGSGSSPPTTPATSPAVVERLRWLCENTLRLRLGGRGSGHGKRTSSAGKTKELGEVGNRPAGPFALDFHGVFAGILLMSGHIS